MIFKKNSIELFVYGFWNSFRQNAHSLIGCKEMIFEFKNVEGN